MKIVKKTELLESVARTGKKKFWLEQVVTDGKDYYIQSEYYQQDKNGKDSKHTLSTPYLVTPTNVGRANYRDGKEQALFQLESDFKKQCDKGYHKIGENNDNKLPLAMLANKFLEKLRHVIYDIFGNFKYNGVRNMYKTEIGAWSRKGKMWDKRCYEHLVFDTQGYIMDGELMLPHSKNSFQEGMRSIKKYRKTDEYNSKGEFCPASSKLWYYVYDIVIPGKTCKERYEILKKLSKNFPKQVKLAEYVVLKNREEVEEFLDLAISLGYEGAILRNMDGMYEINHRSNGLLKYKRFMDEEFEIVDVIEGEGSDKGCAIFVCITKEGNRFNANPNGTDKVRRAYFKDRKNLIGKSATITFQAWTDKKIPYIIKEFTIRDYE